MLQRRYRLRVPSGWWEDHVQVEALAALAAWTRLYDSGEWDDPPGKLQLLYDLDHVGGYSVATASRLIPIATGRVRATPGRSRLRGAPTRGAAVRMTTGRTPTSRSSEARRHSARASAVCGRAAPPVPGAARDRRCVRWRAAGRAPSGDPHRDAALGVRGVRGADAGDTAAGREAPARPSRPPRAFPARRRERRRAVARAGAVPRRADPRGRLRAANGSAAGPREEVFVGVTPRDRAAGGRERCGGSRWLWVDVDEPDRLERLYEFLAERPCAPARARRRLGRSSRLLGFESRSRPAGRRADRGAARADRAGEPEADPPPGRGPAVPRPWPSVEVGRVSELEDRAMGEDRAGRPRTRSLLGVASWSATWPDPEPERNDSAAGAQPRE